MESSTIFSSIGVFTPDLEDEDDNGFVGLVLLAGALVLFNSVLFLGNSFLGLYRLDVFRAIASL